MRRIVLLLLLALVLTRNGYAQSALKRSTPEEVGVRSGDVQEFLDALMSHTGTTMHGVMVLRRGQVIAEAWNAPFKAAYGHTLYSVSKTFTAAAVGLCVEDSLLRLSDPVARFFPEDLPPVPSDTLRRLTVEHLLTMRSGLPVRYAALRRDSVRWARAFLGQGMEAEPGSRFAYDSMVTYLLAAIVQRVTGRTLLDYLEERLFAPLGIRRAAWESSPEGVHCGGWGLYLRLEDMAKFGQLLLDGGRWEGERILDEAWVRAMMAPSVTQGAGHGYGYQLCMTSRPGTVRADGAYGQYIFVVPDKQMVIAILQNQIHSASGNPAGEQWLLVNRLLNKVVSETALPRDPASALLRRRQESYRLQPARGEERSLRHLSLYTQPVTLQLGGNLLGWETLRVSQTRDGELRMGVTTTSGVSYAITCGHGKWVTGRIKGEPLVYSERQFLGQFSGLERPFYVAGSYGWFGSGGDDLFVRLQYVNWISGCRLHFRFSGTAVSSLKLRLGHTTQDLVIPILRCE